MMIRSMLRSALATMALAFLDGTAQAEPITFYFAGTDGSNPFSGSFTYDTSTPSSSGSSTSPTNEYYGSSDPISASFNYNGFSDSGTGTTSSSYIEVDGTTGGHGEFLLYVQAASGFYLEIILKHNSSSAPFQNSTALPTALNLADFPDQASVSFGAGDFVHYLNSTPITSLTTSPTVVPEPSSLIAMATALPFVALLARGIRSRAAA